MVVNVRVVICWVLVWIDGLMYGFFIKGFSVEQAKFWEREGKWKEVGGRRMEVCFPCQRKYCGISKICQLGNSLFSLGNLKTPFGRLTSSSNPVGNFHDSPLHTHSWGHNFFIPLASYPGAMKLVRLVQLGATFPFVNAAQLPLFIGKENDFLIWYGNHQPTLHELVQSM